MSFNPADSYGRTPRLPPVREMICTRLVSFCAGQNQILTDLEVHKVDMNWMISRASSIDQSPTLG